MRYFKYVDQSGEHITTDAEILRDYYDYWYGRMLKVGKENPITDERCIEDFCTVNWAYEVFDYE